MATIADKVIILGVICAGEESKNQDLLMTTRLLIILVAVIATGCSFNNKFLKPGKIAPATREITLQADQNPTVIRFEPETRQPEFFRNGTQKIDLPYTIESVLFESTNGNLLNGWMLKPREGTPAITLVHMHGNGGNVVSQTPGMVPFLKYGMQVFVFDYSGFGFSEGKATRENVLQDARAALNYVQDRSDVKGTKLVVYGQSLGGNVAAVVASEQSAEIDGLVLEGAFASHKDMAAGMAGIFGRILVSEKYSAATSIPSYSKPLLVIHSSEDTVVPFEQGRKIYEAANEPREFMEIDKCHICGPRFYPEQIAAGIKAMVD